MLSEHQPLKGEVVAFLGPVNLSGFEDNNNNEIDYLTDLAREAGAIVQSWIDHSVTILVASELVPSNQLSGIPASTRVVSDSRFMEVYLTEVLTGEEWE
ncbi:hypothetical protein BTA51_05820 [Hahella sp. CCB-MM4]|uniref:hypothetical protein n=1 Tax=Hahella sp. (strain CCB-MM4) TaxID=1926491 RepID=UPI000B9AA329|nr:hypothetical protein [Hahella sp. CCB-MM4]OZG74516.1 hypothetical protein BTA51_05820 [Hahella sp. CCB-MM4]